MSASDSSFVNGAVAPYHAYYVMRTLRMLEILAFQPCTASQLAAVMDVHPRTTRRMLQQFVAEDWAVHDPATHRYSLNAHLPSIGIQAVQHSAVVDQALPVLVDLAQELGLDADLFVPSYNEVASIASADASGATKVHIGDVLPHHCSAAGRAILAFRDSWLEPTLQRQLVRFTDRTRTDPRDLSAELGRVRARGWAFEQGEARDGFAGVAAPVWEGASVTAAIGVSMPTGFENVQPIADLVVRASGKLRELRAA